MVADGVVCSGAYQQLEGVAHDHHLLLQLAVLPCGIMTAGHHHGPVMDVLMGHRPIRGSRAIGERSWKSTRGCQSARYMSEHCAVM